MAHEPHAAVFNYYLSSWGGGSHYMYYNEYDSLVVVKDSVMTDSLWDCRLRFGEDIIDKFIKNTSYLQQG